MKSILWERMKSIANSLASSFPNMDAELFEKEHIIDLTWCGYTHQFIRLERDGRTRVAMSLHNLASRVVVPLGNITSGKQAVRILCAITSVVNG